MFVAHPCQTSIGNCVSISFLSREQDWFENHLARDFLWSAAAKFDVCIEFASPKSQEHLHMTAARLSWLQSQGTAQKSWENALVSTYLDFRMIEPEPMWFFCSPFKTRTEFFSSFHYFSSIRVFVLVRWVCGCACVVLECRCVGARRVGVLVRLVLKPIFRSSDSKRKQPQPPSHLHSLFACVRVLAEKTRRAT
jgi:hypothetical protein